MARTYAYQGHEIAYDDGQLRSWRTQKDITGANGPAAMYAAVDRILCGRSDAVADELGDDVDAMLAMLNELASLDRGAKN